MPRNSCLTQNELVDCFLKFYYLCFDIFCFVGLCFDFLFSGIFLVCLYFLVFVFVVFFFFLKDREKNIKLGGSGGEGSGKN